MALIHITPKARRARMARENPNRSRAVVPILIESAVVAGPLLTMIFNQPVSLSGVPRFTTDLPDIAPVSAAKTAANTVAITFDDAIDGAVWIKIGFQDPAIRNASGGYVTSDTVVI